MYPTLLGLYLCNWFRLRIKRICKVCKQYNYGGVSTLHHNNMIHSSVKYIDFYRIISVHVIRTYTGGTLWESAEATAQPYGLHGVPAAGFGESF